ncbi:MAG: hypothetical protein EZS28_014264 [Streblomastix strix]|uniref:Uncharacterized protein n=1 Tax=Streblomastix strix TaxID=222440 RepID=A0A5J4W5K2_9EUKA|nr:MAG: hypothetical protein EZS28_014264 [Streblomastix strix]
MERLGMVDSLNANHNMLEGAGKQLRRSQGRSMDEEEQSETTSGEDYGFLGRSDEIGDQFFKECLLNAGLTVQSIQAIIDGRHGIYKRYACSLSKFAEYLAEQ